MTARAFLEEKIETRLLAFADETSIKVAGRASVPARGSRLSFAANCHIAALTHSRFLYDAVGVARAHPCIPGLNQPYGVWIHGVEVWDSLSPERERVLQRAQFVLVNSNFTLARFQELHGPLANAHVCHLATDDNDPLSEVPRITNRPTVLLIGRADKCNFRKGHKEVIESWAHVVRAVPEAELLLVGGGDGMELLRKTVACSPASDQIKIMGFVAEDKMPDIWARSTVFAQPSWKEGFGLVYVEAMRNGLPVIASIHDAGQEVNIDGETGFNVDLAQPKQLADKLVHLLSNPQAAQRMGQAGRQRWQSHFRFSSFKKRLITILDELP
jgi:phosphatidylinositol alpha-1,6-mannosyltransferase